MGEVKRIMMYPNHTEVEVFEGIHREEHVPMAIEKLMGKTRLVATKVVASANERTPPFYRIAEVHLPSLQALPICAQSKDGSETLAHAVKISSGGYPIFLIYPASRDPPFALLYSLLRQLRYAITRGYRNTAQDRGTNRGAKDNNP